MKKIILSVMVILVFGLTMVSPYGITQAMDGIQALETAAEQYRSTVSEINQQVAAVNNAKNQFDSLRSFELYYGDVDRIIAALNGVVGVTVQRTQCVDAKNGFLTSVDYTEGASDSTLTAVRMTLLVDDTTKALTTLNAMDLPVHDVYVSEPGTVYITFLTGGDLS